MKVAIIIVNWNTGDLLARCLTSLQRLPDSERALIAKVWVIDNASSDASLPQARAAAGGDLDVVFITNKDNRGFAGANNQALREIIAAGVSTHALLLNPDTEVRAGALPALLAVFDEHPEVGIVGPRLTNPDGSLQGSVRPFPTFRDFVLYMLKLGRFIQSLQEGAYDYSRPGYADQVMGAAFLIRDQVLRDIGPLDDGFFILFEEVDYALQAKKKGWKTYFTPAGTIMHVRAASFKQLVGWRKSWPWLKSSLYYARKHLPVWQVAALHALIPITFLLMLPASLKHVVTKYAH